MSQRTAAQLHIRPEERFSFDLGTSQGSEKKEPIERPLINHSIDLPAPVLGSEYRPIIGLFILLNILLLQGAVWYGIVPPTATSIPYVSHTLALCLGLGALIAFEQRNFLEMVKRFDIKKLSGRACQYFAFAILFGVGVYEFIATPMVIWTTLESFSCAVGLYLIFSWALASLFRKIYFGCTFIPDVHPDSVQVVTEDGIKKLSPQSVKVGDKITVSAGERILFDGEVVTGCAEVLERKFTGQTQLLVKDPLSRVYAGSEVQLGSLVISVKALLDEGFIHSFAGTVRQQLSVIIEQYEAGLKESGRIELGVLFLSVLLIALGFSNHGNLVHGGLLPAAAVLLSGLLLDIVPLTFYLKRRLILSSYSRGVLFREFDSTYEQLATSQSCALCMFSHPGAESMRISAYEILDERIDPKALASITVSLSARSEHPIFEAIAGYLRKHNKDLTLYRPKDISLVEQPNLVVGLFAQVEDIHFSIGSEGLLIESGIQMDVVDLDSAGDDQYVYYVAIGKEVVARFRLNTMCLEEEKGAIQNLRNDGMRVAFFSNKETEETDRHGALLGVDPAEVFPNTTASLAEDVLTRLSPKAIVVDEATPQGMQKDIPVTFGQFNEFHWDLAAHNVTTFSARIQRSCWTMYMIRLLQRSIQHLRLFIQTVGAVLLFGGALHILNEVTISVALVLIVFYCRQKVSGFLQATEPVS